MKIIKKLSEMIREEMNDAEQYAKCALKYKAEDQRLANMFYTISKQEMEHANMEHEQAVRFISESNVEAPEAMRAVWDWEHELLIDKTARIRALHDMYKA